MIFYNILKYGFGLLAVINFIGYCWIKAQQLSNEKWPSSAVPKQFEVEYTEFLYVVVVEKVNYYAKALKIKVPDFSPCTQKVYD